MYKYKIYEYIKYVDMNDIYIKTIIIRICNYITKLLTTTFKLVKFFFL